MNYGLAASFVPDLPPLTTPRSLANSNLWFATRTWSFPCL